MNIEELFKKVQDAYDAKEEAVAYHIGCEQAFYQNPSSSRENEYYVAVINSFDEMLKSEIAFDRIYKEFVIGLKLTVHKVELKLK